MNRHSSSSHLRKALQGLAMSLMTLCTVQAQPSPLSADATVSALLGGRPTSSAGQSATLLADGRWLLAGGDAAPSQLRIVDFTTRASTVLPLSLHTPRSHHSASLLPDGTVLIYGGLDTHGNVLSSAEHYSPVAGQLSEIANLGLQARADHTATVLPDGRVLIAGGMDTLRIPLLLSDLYDPANGKVERIATPMDVARLDPLAVLAPDASVLLWGGTDSTGTPLSNGDRYDYLTHLFTLASPAEFRDTASALIGTSYPAVTVSRPAANEVSIAVDQALMVRFSQRMAVESLNAQTVTLIGPTGSLAIKPVAVEQGVLLFVTPSQDLLPGASYTLFISGARDTLGRALPFTAIGFTTATLDGSATAGGAGTSAGGSASGSSGNSSSGASQAGSSGNILAGLRHGPIATTGGSSSWASSLTAMLANAHAFGESGDASLNAAQDDELWIPGPRNYHGDWSSGHRHRAEQTLPHNPDYRRAVYGDPAVVAALAKHKLKPMDVARGVLTKLAPASRYASTKGATALAGQVLKLNGLPLANVSLSVNGVTTRTDYNGEFLLSGIPAGHQVLTIDGGTASNGLRRYGRYDYGTDIVAGQTNALPFVIWMPRLDLLDNTAIQAPTAAPTVITTPRIPGLELHLPAGTVVRDAQGRIVTQLNITAIPTDQPPFPLPPGVPVPTYFTIQPGGAHLESANGQPFAGAQLIYPNFTRSPAGTRIDFWNYDAQLKGWYVYGQGTVSSDGKQVIPDVGVVIYEFTGAMVGVQQNAPSGGPPPGPGDGSQGGPGNDGGPGTGGSGSSSQDCDSGNAGDPVNCFTGLFLYERELLPLRDTVSVPVVSRVYRPQDNGSRAFGIGTNLSYDFFTVGDINPYTYQDLILPDGGRVHFPRVSAGTSWTDAVYQNTTTPGKFYGAILQWNTSIGYSWSLTLRDGTVYWFPEAAGSTSARAGAVRQIDDPHGNSIKLTRDGSSNLTQITTPNARHLNFSYDSSSRVIQVSDDLSRKVQYAYDANGRLSTVTDPSGNTQSHTYDANNNMLTVTDKNGNVMVSNTYDTSNRVIQQNFPDGTHNSFSYTLDANGKVTQTSYTDQRGMVTQRNFNANGYITSMVFAVGKPIQQTMTLNRDPDTNLVNSVTDSLGRVTAYSYDILGNLTQITQLSGTQNAIATSISYDAASNLPSQITDPLGHVTKLSYDTAANLKQATDALNHSTAFTYDAQGRVLSITDPNKNPTKLAYDGADLAALTNALGYSGFFGHDATGRLTAITDPLTAQSSRAYDALGRISSSTDANGAQLHYSYDANGNLLTTTDADGHVTTYGYDAMNRVTAKKDALLQVESYQYEPGGNIKQKIDRNGQLTAWTYDLLGRVTQIGYGATASNPTAYTSTVQYTWDAGNRLTKIADSISGTITRSYDGLDRLTKEVTPQGTISYTYDAANRRKTMTVTGQPKITYTYDNANRLTKLSQAAGPSNGNVVQNVSFIYDNANRRTQTTLANGIKITYSYDAANQLSGISYSQSNGTSIGNLSYSYDAAGHRISEGGSLANVKLPASGSMGVYDDNNRLTMWNGASYNYDANGNLLDDGTNTYSWDARGQLASLGGAASASFAYDAFGRRIGKTVNGGASGYVYDGLNFVQEKSGSGSGAAVTANLLTGGIDEVFARMNSTGAVSSVLPDALGSTLAESSAAQVLTASYAYEPYGATTVTGSGTLSQQYTGRENDNTGLYYYRARYYSPATGRFISEDPIGWASGQANDYAYVGGDPMSFVDPLGHCETTPGNSSGVAGKDADDWLEKIKLIVNLYFREAPEVPALPTVVPALKVLSEGDNLKNAYEGAKQVFPQHLGGETQREKTLHEYEKQL